MASDLKRLKRDTESGRMVVPASDGSEAAPRATAGRSSSSRHEVGAQVSAAAAPSQNRHVSEKLPRWLPPLRSASGPWFFGNSGIVPHPPVSSANPDHSRSSSFPEHEPRQGRRFPAAGVARRNRHRLELRALIVHPPFRHHQQIQRRQPGPGTGGPRDAGDAIS